MRVKKHTAELGKVPMENYLSRIEKILSFWGSRKLKDCKTTD